MLPNVEETVSASLYFGCDSYFQKINFRVRLLMWMVAGGRFEWWRYAAGWLLINEDATQRLTVNNINAPPQATMAGSISQSMDTSDGDQIMDDGSLELNEHVLAATSRPQMTVSSDEINYLVFRYVLQRASLYLHIIYFRSPLMLTPSI